jgi:hypothetical protein
MRYALVCLWISAIGLSACGGSDGDAVPTAPEPVGPDLSGHAFQLTINAQTGEIGVAGPRLATSARGSASGPSLSLIGSDGIEFEVRSGCRFSPIPNKPKLRRCTFRVELTNRMQGVDLMTPTEFPRAPAGITGILLFPWTAVAEGGTDPTAVPSPDWDHGPVDFFNDFVGCSSGGKSDCYRYETLPSPVYGGATAGNPEIGFDIPIDATRVTAYIVVAADLRSNRRITFGVFADQCTNVRNDGGPPGGELRAGRISSDPLIIVRAFCLFDNPLPSDALLVSGELRITFLASSASSNLQAEYLDFGPTIDAGDFDLPSISNPRIFQCCREGARDFAAVNVSAIQQANDAGATELGFRFTLEDEGSVGVTTFDGFGTVDNPFLELTWIRR